MYRLIQLWAFWRKAKDEHLHRDHMNLSDTEVETNADKVWNKDTKKIQFPQPVWQFRYSDWDDLQHKIPISEKKKKKRKKEG